MDMKIIKKNSILALGKIKAFWHFYVIIFEVEIKGECWNE